MKKLSLINVFLAIIAINVACLAQTPQPGNTGFSDLAWPDSVEESFDWGANLNQTLFVGMGADALFSSNVFRSSPPSHDQLRSGSVTFVESVMPLDFVFWVRAATHEITLFAGGNTQPFTNLLSPLVWYDGGESLKNVADLEILGVELPNRYVGTWVQMLEKGHSVTIKPGENIRARARIKLRPGLLQRINADRHINQRRMKVSIGINLGAIKGNEKLKEFLDNRGGGRPKSVFTPAILFRLIPDLDSDPTRLDYYLWHLRSIKQQFPNWRDEQLAHIVTAYESILKIEPKNVYILLDYAKDLEESKKYQEAITIAKRLILVAETEAEALDILRRTSPFGFYMVPGQNLAPIDTDKDVMRKTVIYNLNAHIKRLEGKLATR